MPSPAISIILTMFITLTMASPLASRTGESADNTCSAPALNSTGFQYYEKGSLEEAEKYYLLAIECDPTVKYYYNNLAVVYMKKGRYEKAIPCLQICIALDPFYVKALSNMAVASAHRLDFAGAYRFYRRAMAADREYTLKKFDSERVRAGLEDLQDRYPHNDHLRFIMHHLDTPDRKK